MPTNNSDNDDTLVWGARAIGLELNLPPPRLERDLIAGNREARFLRRNREARGGA